MWIALVRAHPSRDECMATTISIASSPPVRVTLADRSAHGVGVAQTGVDGLRQGLYLCGRAVVLEGIDCFLPTVEEFGCRIEPVWPDDRASVVIDSNLAEVVEFPERFAERAVQQEGAIDDAHDPVVEFDLKLVAVKRFGCGHAQHASILRERVDLDQWFQRLGELPIDRELAAMELCPFAHEANRPRRQRTIQHFQ